MAALRELLLTGKATHDGSFCDEEIVDAVIHDPVYHPIEDRAVVAMGVDLFEPRYAVLGR
jgi:hypothetical protein